MTRIAPFAKHARRRCCLPIQTTCSHMAGPTTHDHPNASALQSLPPPSDFRAARENVPPCWCQESGREPVRAYHGSPGENWHSIVRLGLENRSGGRFERTVGGSTTDVYMG